MTELKNLKLFSTHPHPCGYLEEEEATTVFVDPRLNLNADIYNSLSRIGFRRSGKHIYRPNCSQCQACVPLRINVANFTPSRGQKRCAKRNADLDIEIVKSINSDEHYALYENYIAHRHSDGDMYPPSRAQYSEFLCSTWGITRYVEFRNPEGNLIAIAVCDMLQDGISAIYTFFDPCQHQRSLGAFAILFQISWAKQLNLSFVYLGYWIKRCEKMRYKTDYKPYELLIDNQWIESEN